MTRDNPILLSPVELAPLFPSPLEEAAVVAVGLLIRLRRQRTLLSQHCNHQTAGRDRRPHPLLAAAAAAELRQRPCQPHSLKLLNVYTSRSNTDSHGHSSTVQTQSRKRQTLVIACFWHLGDIVSPNTTKDILVSIYGALRL